MGNSQPDGRFCGAYSGAGYLVDNASALASKLGIPNMVIGLIIVATCTSLPELVTSVVAAKKGNTGIAVGNIAGSNIFNTFLVIGISAVIYPVRIAPGTGLDLLVNIFASFLLFLFIFTGRGRKIERWEALVFIFAYMLYFVYIIN